MKGGSAEAENGERAREVITMDNGDPCDAHNYYKYDSGGSSHFIYIGHEGESGE